MYQIVLKCTNMYQNGRKKTKRRLTDNGTLLILILHSLEVGSRVLISNSIFEGIGLRRMLLGGSRGVLGGRGVLGSGFVGGGSISGGTIGHGESHGGADKGQECQALN